jgi:hypothetical protein
MNLRPSPHCVSIFLSFASRFSAQLCITLSTGQNGHLVRFRHVPWFVHRGMVSHEDFPAIGWNAMRNSLSHEDFVSRPRPFGESSFSLTPLTFQSSHSAHHYLDTQISARDNLPWKIKRQSQNFAD